MNHLAYSAPLAIACFVAGCGGPADGADGLPVMTEAVAPSSSASFTGHLAAFPTSAVVGSSITVTETATNLTSSTVGPVIIGINRVGFDVSRIDDPPTGICRGAGSVTCNFVELDPGETQSLTLTLVPTTAGVFTIKGWTRSSYMAGGSLDSATIAVQ
jgi:hypothetical protein